MLDSGVDESSEDMDNSEEETDDLDDDSDNEEKQSIIPALEPPPVNLPKTADELRRARLSYFNKK